MTPVFPGWYCLSAPCFHSPGTDSGFACLVWVGSGRVVEGNRQLEMGANVECEELGCVVGGPLKPNKLREVRGLVWRPWINKLSEMTMRCADICHHTALVFKHSSPKPSSSSFSARPGSLMVPVLLLILPLIFSIFHPLHIHH